MGTAATIHVVASGPDAKAAMERAFGWFHQIEARCTRFDPCSELMQLSSRIGEPVAVSAILFEALRFAVMVAEESGGAFDPTVGREMESRGFNREHRTGAVVRSGPSPAGDTSYRDVQLDPDRRTITLLRPLTLDLGAVAKGLAVDMAARELGPFRDFAIDAGGDLYLGGLNRGLNPEGEPWRVGIRHPRHEDELIASLQVSNQAVCTSGDYRMRIPGFETGGSGSHILDPRDGTSAHTVASATVIAPGAMLADALATAIFVLGPEEGLRLLNRLDVQGLIVTPDLQCYETEGLCHVA
jgi:thiamine biosynthesis lipoprotein